jgi:hypothetical protein
MTTGATMAAPVTIMVMVAAAVLAVGAAVGVQVMEAAVEVLVVAAGAVGVEDPGPAEVTQTEWRL